MLHSTCLLLVDVLRNAYIKRQVVSFAFPDENRQFTLEGKEILSRSYLRRLLLIKRFIFYNKLTFLLKEVHILSDGGHQFICFSDVPIKYVSRRNRSQHLRHQESWHFS